MQVVDIYMSYNFRKQTKKKLIQWYGVMSYMVIIFLENQERNFNHSKTL